MLLASCSSLRSACSAAPDMTHVVEQVLAEMVLKHQEARQKVTGATVESFTSVRDMSTCLDR